MQFKEMDSHVEPVKDAAESNNEKKGEQKTAFTDSTRRWMFHLAKPSESATEVGRRRLFH